MKRFLTFFLILMLTGVSAIALAQATPDGSHERYYGQQPQSVPQSHDDEVPDDDNGDDGDEEKEDDDYD